LKLTDKLTAILNSAISLIKKWQGNAIFEVSFKKDYSKDKGDNSLFHLLKQTIIAFYYYQIIYYN